MKKKYEIAYCHCYVIGISIIEAENEEEAKAIFRQYNLATITSCRELE